MDSWETSSELRGGLWQPPRETSRKIQRYLGDLKGFGAVDDPTTIVTRGASMKAASPGAGPDRAPKHRNHRSAAEHVSVFPKKTRHRSKTAESPSDKEVSRALNPEPTGVTPGGGRHR